MSLSIKQVGVAPMFGEPYCHHCWDTRSPLIDLWWIPDTRLRGSGFDLYTSRFCHNCVKLLTKRCDHFSSVNKAAAYLVTAKLLGKSDD